MHLIGTHETISCVFDFRKCINILLTGMILSFFLFHNPHDLAIDDTEFVLSKVGTKFSIEIEWNLYRGCTHFLCYLCVKNILTHTSGSGAISA